MQDRVATYSVLFLCMGNICRSPTAHAVFRHKMIHSGLANQVRVDSAGTHNYHPGEAPDHRTQRHAAQRGMTCQTCGPGRSGTQTLQATTWSWRWTGTTWH